MATRMLQRRGTAAEWAAANPILSDGEIGFERDTRIIKIGDGVTAWNSLKHDYVRQVGGDVITPSSVGVVPLAVQTITGQTSNAFEVRGVGGEVISRFSHSGDVDATGSLLGAYIQDRNKAKGYISTGESGINFSVHNRVAGNIPLALIGNGKTQTVTNKALTANVATLTTSVVHGFTAGRKVVVSGVDATFDGTYTIKAVPTTTTFTYDKVAADVVSVASGGTANAHTQTAPLLDLRDHVGASRANFDAFGKLSTPALKIFGTDDNSIFLQHGRADAVAVIIRTAAGQTANSQEWQNNSGGLLASMSQTGHLTIPRLTVNGDIITSAGGSTQLGGGGYFGGTLNVQSRTTDNSAIIAKKITGQTADIMSVRDDGNVNYVRVGAAGDINALAGLSYGRWPGTDTPGVVLQYTDGGAGTARNLMNRHGANWEWAHESTSGTQIQAVLSGRNFFVGDPALGHGMGRGVYGPDSHIRRLYMTGSADFGASMSIRPGVYGGTGAPAIVIRSGAAGHDGVGTLVIQNSGAQTGFSVEPVGRVRMGQQNNGGLGIGSAGGGQPLDRSVIAFTNVGANPANFGGGGSIFTESGRLFYKGELGTVTQLGAA